jgi:MFS family permease
MGVLEATVNCGFVLITAKWYRKYEHSSRVGVWAASNGLSTMIGAVVAYGCSIGSTEAGLTFHGWKILSIVCGGITIIFSVCMYFFMANSPIDAKFFSEQDKTLAIERLRDNHQGVGSRYFKWHQFREAFTDLRVRFILKLTFDCTMSNVSCRLGYMFFLYYLRRFQAVAPPYLHHSYTIHLVLMPTPACSCQFQQVSSKYAAISDSAI